MSTDGLLSFPRAGMPPPVRETTTRLLPRLLEADRLDHGVGGDLTVFPCSIILGAADDATQRNGQQGDRSRLNTALVVGNIIGGALGSALASTLWGLAGCASTAG